MTKRFGINNSIDQIAAVDNIFATHLLTEGKKMELDTRSEEYRIFTEIVETIEWNVDKKEAEKTILKLGELLDKVSQMQLPVILQGELLPCPFCGNEAELIEKGNNYTKKRFVTIKCTNKNCRVEMTNGAIRNDMDWLKGISTNAWNKRAGREPQSK